MQDGTDINDSYALAYLIGDIRFRWIEYRLAVNLSFWANPQSLQDWSS